MDGMLTKPIEKIEHINLGKEWIVDACNGHVQDLPNNGSSKQSNKAMWASKEGFLPEPPWAWTERAERVISKMIEKAKKKNVEEEEEEDRKSVV